VNVLVTYGWCRTAYVVTRSLLDAGHRVYVASERSPSMAGWARGVAGRRSTRSPLLDAAGFVEDIRRAVAEWEIDLVFPGHEDALPLLRQRAVFPDDLIFACPALADLELGVDKGRFLEAAMAAGASLPRTEFPRSIARALELGEQISYPVVVKLRRSNSGKGVAVAQTSEELESILAVRFSGPARRPDDFPLLQSFVPGVVVGAGFLAHDGVPLGIFCERYLRAKEGGFGTSVFREPLESAALKEEVARLISGLKWTGLGHFDFIEDRSTGDFFLLEMNPRPWGAISMARANGFDFPAAMVTLLTEGPEAARDRLKQTNRSRRGLWLVGEGIAAVHQLKTGRPAAALGGLGRALASIPGSKVDDATWTDPVPLIAESICYFRGFVSAGGQVNPEAGELHP